MTQRSYEDEYTADELATQILLNLQPPNCAGGLCFLTVHRIVGEVAAAMGISFPVGDTLTHPASSKRIRRIEKILDESQIEDAAELGRYSGALFDQMRQRIEESEISHSKDGWKMDWSKSKG